MADLQLYLEAEKRGLLPPEKQALLTEARSRGLIPKLDDPTATPPPDIGAVPAAAAPAPETKPVSAWDAASKADIVAGLPATRMVMGVAAPVIGAFQLAANVGDEIAKKFGLNPVLGQKIAEHVATLEGMKQRGMAALGEPTPNDIAGGVGALATGVGAAGKIAPATTYVGKVAQGATAGAIAGATTPSTTPGIDQSLTQAEAGAALGGGIPAVAPAVAGAAKAGYRTLVEPWINPAAIKGRAYLEAAGSKAQEIVNALRANQEIVPGSIPTAAEAAAGVGRAEFSAFGKSAEKVLPSNYLARSDAQNAARIAQIQTVGGDAAKLASAQASREAEALANYAAANVEGMDQEMAKALRPQIKMLMQRPDIVGAKRVATQLAKNQNTVFDGFGSVEGLDWLKKGLDEQIGIAAKASSAAGKEQLRSLMQTKGDLLAVIKEIAPAYDAARAAFAKSSVPINQMEVGQYLEKKLVPALGEETAALKSRSFAAAVQDAPGTLKRSLTGAPRYEELTSVLNPQQMAAVNSIKDDLARQTRNEMMAQKGAQAGPNAMDVASQSISTATGGGKIPNPLSRIVTVANAIIGRLEGKIDRKLAIEIANEMLNPATTANVMQQAITRAGRGKAMKDVVNKLRLPGTIAATQNALVTQD